jgi:hypothetical protein
VGEELFMQSTQLDPEWLREFANFLDKKGNRDKYMEVKKIFVEAYFENVREGMNSKDALQKAKTVASCFLAVQ